MLNVTLYVRKNSAACEEVKSQLGKLQDEFPHRLVEVDVETDPILLAKYGGEVPVLEAGPYRIRAPISTEQLRMTVGAASDRKGQLEQVGDPEYQQRITKGQSVGFADRVSFWVSKHNLLLLNLFVFIYVGLPFLAPTLMKVGAVLPAQAIYRIYKPLCHQFAFRSFFLYGEQFYYPLKEAGLSGVKTFDEVSGIQNLSDPFNYARLEARNFIGNDTVGYKMALCERDVAIYSAILLFGMIFWASGRRIKSLHWIVWILLGIAPIALDGFSQLFSQFNWTWLVTYLPYRESTPFLRVLTGGLFGFCTAWFAYPNIEESMNETRAYYLKKFAVHQVSNS